MADGTLLQESIAFRRRDDLPGVEVLDVESSSRNWRWFNTSFGITLIRSWYGEAHYRHRSHAVVPGMVFCAEPGETHTTPRVTRAGSFTAYMFDADVLRTYLAEHDDNGRYPHWNKVVHTTSASLAMKIAALSGALDRDATAMQAQSCFADVVAAVAVEIMGRAPSSAARLDPAARAAERIRECLHEDRAGIDLTALAKETGLNRFQVLRAFKRRYGLPPHAYQLSVRVARARQLLVTGMRGPCLRRGAWTVRSRVVRRMRWRRPSVLRAEVALHRATNRVPTIRE